MTTMTFTQTKMLQDLLAIQKVYDAGLEMLDIARDAAGNFFLTTADPGQAEVLEGKYQAYPVPLGADFEAAKDNLLDIIAD